MNRGAFLLQVDKLRERAAEMRIKARHAASTELRKTYEDLATMYDQLALSVDELAQLQARMAKDKNAP